MNCPDCASSDVRRAGSSHLRDGEKIQRYRCNYCGKCYQERRVPHAAGGRALSPAKDRAIRADIAADRLTNREIATKHGVSYATVYARTPAGIANAGRRATLAGERQVRERDDPAQPRQVRPVKAMPGDLFAMRWERAVARFEAEGMPREEAEERATVEASRRLTA